MDVSDFDFDVAVATDSQFPHRKVGDIFAGVEIPEYARGFTRGARTLISTATKKGDTRRITVAIASGVILEHPQKPPLLYVVYTGANEPFQGLGLEEKVLDNLIGGGREVGCSGGWLCTEVSEFVNARNSNRH